MKKLNLNPEPIKTIINISELKKNSIVGIQWEENKAIVMKNSKGYFAITNNQIDLTSCFFEPKIKDYLKRASKDIKEVYVFDSVKECLKWMSE